MWEIIWTKKETGWASSGGKYQSKNVVKSLLTLLPRNYPGYEYSMKEVKQ